MDQMTQAPQTPLQQVPVAPEVTLNSNPIQQPPRKNFRKLFSISSWIFLFAFLPLTVLIFISQDSIPGDLFYPVKRSLENVILAAASVSPATRAAFRTDLTTRRFDEAEKLLLASSGTNGLKDFVTEIGAAQNEVSAISDPVKKQELQQKIQTSVTEYEKRLNVVKVKLVEQEEVSQLAFAPTNTPISVPTSTPKPPILSNSPTTIPTKEITVLITATPIPSFTPIPTPTPTPPPTREEETIGTVDRVQDFLHCLKKTPPPHRECTPPEIKSANQSLEDKSERRKEDKLKQEDRRKDLEENRNEEKEQREKRNEDNKPDKEKSDKESGTSNRHK